MIGYHAFDFAPGACDGCRSGCADCDPQPVYEEEDVMLPAIDDPFPGVRHVVVHPDPIVSGWWTAQLFDPDGESDVLEGSYPSLGQARLDAILKWDPAARKIPVAVVSQYRITDDDVIVQ